jgi:hypothetical protein
MQYQMICNAYVATLLRYNELRAPLYAQMVTVWPVDTINESNRLNASPRDRVCEEAAQHYGLPISLNAVRDAEQSQADLSGSGPFLLAWSPGNTKGEQHSLVLVADLSDMTTPQQAKDYFSRWAEDIQKDPKLWERGWNTEKLATVIRLWADKWGPKLLRVFGVQK